MANHVRDVWVMDVLVKGMKKWFVHAKKADFIGWAEKYGIDPILARIIRNRDITEEKALETYLYGDIEQCYAPSLLKDLEKTAAIIEKKITEGKKIRIIGDYDVDGICSTYILLRALEKKGAVVDYSIPHRMKDGYGLNDSLIEDAIRNEIDTILTCDNGIAAIPQIKMAKEAGMTVLVTDHHEVSFEELENGEKQYLLPEADCIVNPKQPDCNYPFPNICGAVVAWKLAIRLLPEEKELWENELLQIAALATVCDVMELVDENRILVKEGLKKMSQTELPGLRALLAVNGLQGKKLSAYHMGFVIGPCLNATGRLDTAARALELLRTTEYEKAVILAEELKELNASRKEMTSDGIEEAVAIVEKNVMQTGVLDKVLVLYLPKLHESLAGIVAGKIKDRYVRPVFVLTDGEEGVKGSGRSIASYDMYEEMTKCKDLYVKYGGHKMAAGLSISQENVDSFRKRMNENCTLTEEEFVDKIYIDVPMPLSYVTEEFIEQLELLEPFGNGNSKPVFAVKNLQVMGKQIFGKNANVGKYKIQDENGGQYTLVSFGEQKEFLDFLEQKQYRDISILYYPSVNEFRGRKSIEFILQDYC